MKNLYLTLAIIGAIVPYAFFTPFILENGLNLNHFISQLFANGPAGGFSADLLITSVVFWIFLFSKEKVKHRGLMVILNLTIGLSCALPYYFYRREVDLA